MIAGLVLLRRNVHDAVTPTQEKCVPPARPLSLVTGASAGIGAAFARALAARGHDFVLVARATDRLNALATELRNAYGIAVEVITADLVDGSQLEPVLRRLRSNPPVDILINNAGAALIGDFATANPTKMDQLLRLNVVAPTLLASAAIGGMVERGTGAIVNIASVLALLPNIRAAFTLRPNPT